MAYRKIVNLFEASPPPLTMAPRHERGGMITEVPSGIRCYRARFHTLNSVSAPQVLIKSATNALPPLSKRDSGRLYLLPGV
jgi:hypothetical protein